MNTTLNIGLAGLGTVGGGLVRLLSENAEEIRARSGCDFYLKAVAVRNPNRKRDLPEGVRLTTDPMTLADDPDIDVVIELMGGIDTAKELITRSLAKGKQVVTANKALLAEEGESLFRLADEKGATLLYEASVAGGIPIVQTLKESLTGNHITSLEGILNGTGNYILSEMTSKGVNFAPALAEAQEKGYAEADPTLDIDGFDTAHKLVLLIRLAWGVDYPYTKMPIEGIRNLDKMDIDFAREFGYRIKLLGRARMRDGKLEAGVFPTLVNHTYLLARVGGAYNAVRVEGNAVGSLFLHGLGAGTLHRKGDGVKLHGRAGNIGYGNAVALGDTDVDAIEIGLDGLRGHVVSEPFAHGLGGEMSRSRGGNADPAVMARPEDTLLGFVVRDQIHCAFAGFGDHCVEIDDMAEALRDALGDRRQDNPRVAVPHKHNVSQVIVLDQVDHIHDVGFQRDPVGKEMGTLGKPGEAHGENRMSGIAEPVRHRLPAPCPAP